MSAPRQLAMFGDPTPAPEAPAVEPAPEVEPQAARHVSAARQVRALTLSLPVVGQADPDPPGFDGWRDYLGQPMPRTDARGTCAEVALRRRPDGTLAPCPRIRCPHHLAVEIGERVDLGPIQEAELVASTAGLPVGMGRRPSLSAIPETEGEVHAFAVAVIERHDGTAPPLPYTCTLDVVRDYPDGAPIAVIMAALGISEELVRLTLRAGEVRLAQAGIHPMAVVAEDMARLEGKSRELARVADPLPVPSTIRRVEREAPAPREPTADELFTF